MAQFHGKYNPKQDVDIECMDCGKTYHEVRRSEGLPGVPATYISAAEAAHKSSPEHQSKRLADWEHEVAYPGTPQHPETIVGRIDNFIHGKDAKNPWTGNNIEDEGKNNER